MTSIDKKPTGKAGPHALLSVVRRGDHVESQHKGSMVVVQGTKVLYAWGSPDERTYARSCLKPFQALPTLERGLADDFSDDEVALLSASHSGSPRHTEVARRILARGGFREDDLCCGVHAPYDTASAHALIREGVKPTRLHNNCSGKHSGFLHLARATDTPLARCLDVDSAVQREVLLATAAMCDLDPSDVPTAIDGCGAPTFYMPLVALARGFCKLANPAAAGLSPERQRACTRLFKAVTNHPELLAGEGRLCTALIRSAPGGIYPKNGAEGVYAAGIPGKNLGIAVKVVDGNERGYFPVIIEVLLRLGLWREVPEVLADFSRVPIRNTQGKLVGSVEGALSWPERQ